MAKNKERAGSATEEAASRTADEVQKTGADILSMTTRMAERSTEQFSQFFGAGRDAELATRKYGQRMEVLQECGSAMAKGYQDISREYLSFARGQFEANVVAFSRLAQCRTPQELLAAQNQLFGESIALALKANGRFAEIAKEVADQTTASIEELADKNERADQAAR
jgi:hypothetical protein